MSSATIKVILILEFEKITKRHLFTSGKKHYQTMLNGPPPLLYREECTVFGIFIMFKKKKIPFKLKHIFIRLRLTKKTDISIWSVQFNGRKQVIFRHFGEPDDVFPLPGLSRIWEENVLISNIGRAAYRTPCSPRVLAATSNYRAELDWVAPVTLVVTFLGVIGINIEYNLNIKDQF